MSQPESRLRACLVLCFGAALALFPTVASAQLFVPSSGFPNSIRSFDPQTGASLGTFVPGGAPLADYAAGLTFGPDGTLYVSSNNFDSNTFQILRFSVSGAYLGTFVPNSLVPNSPNFASFGPFYELAFGPDQNLYANALGHRLLRYDGKTGAFLGVFVESLNDSINAVLFGPDGNLYVATYDGTGTNGGQVLRYNGQTGALMGVFVTNGSGGLNLPDGLAFGPDGNLYVSSALTNQVLRYNGHTGAFISAFVPAASGGLNLPAALTFGADGSLFVGSGNPGQILHYNGTTGAFLGVSASGDVAPGQFLIRTPECEATTAQTSYANGDALTINLHVANLQSAGMPVEFKLWLDVPTAGSIGLANAGGDGKTSFPAIFNQNVPLSLGTVSASFPRGSYQLGCRLLNPDTGGIRSETIRTFIVQ